MAEKNKELQNKNIKELDWKEHIRKRPGMYIGSVDIKGFCGMLKSVISSTIEDTATDWFSIEFVDDFKAKIRLNNLNGEISNGWSKITHSSRVPNPMDFLVFNALSDKFSIRFQNLDKDTYIEENYERGVLINGDIFDKVKCSIIELEFTLDKFIWGEDFRWNIDYINHELKEFAYLYKKTKIEIKYKQDKEDCRIVYHYKNGLKDRIDIEIMKGLGKSFLETEIDIEIDNFHIEAAFAFRNYSVDAPYLKSYVNDYFTFENGSHIDGLLKGLTYGVMKYFQKHKLTETYKISEKGMKENLVAAINIKMREPVFSGCVRNKLANPEIIEPIANHISELLFDRIDNNAIIAEKLTQKFKI